jgi:hypothetical protein
MQDHQECGDKHYDVTVKEHQNYDDQTMNLKNDV